MLPSLELPYVYHVYQPTTAPPGEDRRQDFLEKKGELPIT